MMPGAKGLNPHELAHMWEKDFLPRHDMRIEGRIVRVHSTKQSVGIKKSPELQIPGTFFKVVRPAAHLFALFLWLLRSGIPCVDLSLLLIDDCFVIRVREEGSVMLTLSSGVRCADCLCTVRIVDNDGRTLL